MSKLKVLSIDWDYFIDASMEQRCTLFPDGGNENIPYYIRNFLWVTHFNQELIDIGIKNEEFNIIKGVIASDFNKIMITDSHKHIYDFIEENFIEDKLEVTNIDFHHDLYGINDMKRNEVDCGNWMSKLFENYDCEYNWISQKDSDKELHSNIYEIKQLNFENLLSMDFDLLFICKSSIWSPPHLDKYFNEAFMPLLAQSDIEVIYETSVFDDRFNDEFKKMVDEHNNMISKIKNGVEREVL